MRIACSSNPNIDKIMIAMFAKGYYYGKSTYYSILFATATTTTSTLID